MKNASFFSPQNLENRAAIRTAIATVTAVLIAFALHFDRPYWSGMTVVILANIYTGSVIDKAIMRICGTIVGAGIGYFLSGFIVNSFFLYLLSCFFLVAISVYYYNFSRYSYAYLLLAITAFIVISELAIEPQAAFWVAIWRPVEIGLGVLVSALSALVLFPNTINDAMDKSVGQVFTNFYRLFAEVQMVVVDQNRGGIDSLRKENLSSKKQLRKATEMLGFMRRESGFSRIKLDRYRLLLDSLMAFSRLINYYAANTFFVSTNGLLKNTYLMALCTAIVQDMQHIEKSYRGQYSEPFSLRSPDMLSQFMKHLNEILNTPGADRSNLLALAHFFRQVVVILTNLITLNYGSKTVNRPGTKIFNHQDQLRNDPDVIIHGIKAGLAATLALVFWLISNWPGGLNGIISSIVISVRRSLYEMQGISVHRTLGCLCGGGLALTCLGYFPFNMYDFLLLMFTAVWAFSYFSFKLPVYAYIGLQANIALIITLAQQGGAPTSLEAPLERLGGIFIGIAASFLVANGIWRTDLWQLLDRQLHKLTKQLAHNCQYLLTTSRTNRYYDLSNLLWLTRGLLESLDAQHPQGARSVLLQKYHQQFSRIVILQATLSHIRETIDQHAAQMVAKELTLDLPHLATQVADLARLPTQAYLVHKDIDKAIAKINELAPTKKYSAGQLENYQAFLFSLRQLSSLFMARG